jgi:hypothetical protein
VSEVWTDTTAFPLAVEIADDDQLPMADMSATAGSRQRNVTGAVARAQLSGAASFATDPGVGDDSADGYRAGSFWFNTSDSGLFVCTDATAGAAVWVEVPGVTTVTASSTTTLTNKTLASFTNQVDADDVHIQVRNDSGGTLTKGTPVYVTGYNVGQNLVTVGAADASVAGTMPAIAVMQEDVANNATGAAVGYGAITGIDTSAFSVGDVLYVSETAGALTDTAPSDPAITQPIGVVLRSDASDGVLTVRVFALNDSGTGSGDVVGPASAVDNRIAVFDGTTGKLLKDGGSTIAAIVAGAGGRTLLSSDTTYYVDGTSGSDANDGTSSGAGAWATIGKALEVIGETIDLGGFTLTVDIANGTYTDAADYFNPKSPAGTGTIVFDGDTATPSNVVFSKGIRTAGAGQNHPGVYWQFQGIDFAVGASIIPVWVHSGTVKLSNVRIGVCANAMLVETSGYLVIETALELYGNCGAFIWSRYGGLVRIFTTTFTFTGSPAFSFGWYAQADGRILAVGTITNSGTVTGKKYELNGLCIATGTTNAPGSTAGSVANGAIAITTVI